MKFLLFCNRGDTKYHGGHPIKGVMPSPYQLDEGVIISPTSGPLGYEFDLIGERLTFSNLQMQRVAVTGFEPETRRDLSSLSDPRVLPIALRRPTVSHSVI